MKGEGGEGEGKWKVRRMKHTTRILDLAALGRFGLLVQYGAMARTGHASYLHRGEPFRDTRKERSRIYISLFAYHPSLLILSSEKFLTPADRDQNSYVFPPKGQFHQVARLHTDILQILFRESVSHPAPIPVVFQVKITEFHTLKRQH